MEELNMLSYEDGIVLLYAIEIITGLLFLIMKVDSKRKKIFQIIVGITIIVVNLFQICLNIQMNKSYFGDLLVISMWTIFIIWIMGLKKDS